MRDEQCAEEVQSLKEDWKRKSDVALEKLKVCRFWLPIST